MTVLSVVAILFTVGSQNATAASAPVMERLQDAYLSEGQTFSTTVRATDADGDPISLIVSQRPFGSSFTDHGNGTGSFSWKSEYLGALSSTNSPFIVTFLASDGASQSSQSILINVQNVNRAPVVTVPDTVFVEVGDTMTIQPNVFDPDQDRIIWSAPGSPAGALLRDSGGAASVKLEWAPAKIDSGAQVITLMATDEWGLSSSASSVVIVSVGPDYTISIAVDTAFPGEIVSIPVSLKNRVPIIGFELEFDYDPSVMTFISVRNDSARTASFESFTFLVGSPAPGNMKITAQADILDTILTGPLAVGDGPLFYVNFFVSSLNNLAGLFLPVRFNFSPLGGSSSNTLFDTLGGVVDSDAITFVNGGVKVENQSAIMRGDINLNGVPFEVADALRFTNYFIDPATFGLNAEQFANSDINSDGIVASIADLVTLLAIVLGDGPATPKVTPGQNYTVSVALETNQNQIVARFEPSYENVAIGAALLTFVTKSDSRVQSLTLNESPLPEGFVVKSHLGSDTLRFIVYSNSPNSNLSGLAELRFDKPSYSKDNQSFELVSVELASINGETISASLARSGASVLPQTFSLSQNFPNPFNPETKIKYSLTSKSYIKLVIYDILGRRVKTLAQGTAEAGEYTVRWNGVDENGSSVASGMYFYRLLANGQSFARKMTLLK